MKLIYFNYIIWIDVELLVIFTNFVSIHWIDNIVMSSMNNQNFTISNIVSGINEPLKLEMPVYQMDE